MRGRPPLLSDPTHPSSLQPAAPRVSGILDELVTVHPLQLMLDLYIALLAGLACVLEVKSTLLRDHLTLALERHCALLRSATGRGCVYFATGFLAFDVKERAQVLGGGMLLAVGLFNVALGTWVSPKLKRLRRAVAGEAALLATYRSVTGRQPEGLDAAEFGRFCDACGVHFNRLEMQAAPRAGTWGGHLGRAPRAGT